MHAQTKTDTTRFHKLLANRNATKLDPKTTRGATSTRLQEEQTHQELPDTLKTRANTDKCREQRPTTLSFVADQNKPVLRNIYLAATDTYSRIPSSENTLILDLTGIHTNPPVGYNARTDRTGCTAHPTARVFRVH